MRNQEIIFNHKYPVYMFSTLSANKELKYAGTQGDEDKNFNVILSFSHN